MNKKSVVLLGSVITVIAGAGAFIASKVIKKEKLADKKDEVLDFIEDNELIERVNEGDEETLAEIERLTQELDEAKTEDQVLEIFNAIVKIDEKLFRNEMAEVSQEDYQQDEGDESEESNTEHNIDNE